MKGRKKWRSQSRRWPLLHRRERFVDDKKEEEKTDEDLDCKLQLSPIDVDKVLVNSDFEGSVFISRHFRQWF